MFVDIDKNSILFYKAIEDIWCAEQTYKGSPNNAVWSCCQAAEKVMKGFLQCCGIDSDSAHELSIILEAVEREHTPPEDVTTNHIDMAAADVNGDGRVNSADLILFLKYFTQQNIKLGP